MRSSRYHNPFLATLDRPVKQRSCDCPGCDQAGHYRAPQSRERLREYYWFCLDHVRAYNKRWDYLGGLSPEEIEARIRHDAVWERPTWSFSEAQKREQQLRDSINRSFFSNAWDETEPAAEDASPPQPVIGEGDALAVLGLALPVVFAEVKARYRLLVKRHHPDANGGSREAEEKLKIINHAFTTLKAIHQNGN
ncbi:MAG: J domain-containing protein [Alphaproteobacteria bacterium]|nr:J domain-containing protein [Alphaproteobacteria bacterium]